MAVGNNNGTYSVPEGLRGAVQAPGFAYVMQGVQNWNAPRREELDREREQRTEAKRTIESGLNTIRVALASPNLSDAERSKLLTEQMNLEGLQTQLSTGFGGVNVQGILATATAAATSASTMASGIAAGGSTSYAAGSVAAQIHSSQQAVALQNRLYNSDPIYRAETDRIMGEATQGRREVDALVRTSRTLAHELGIDTSEVDRRREEISRERREAERRGDHEGVLRADVSAVDNELSQARRNSEAARAHGNPSQIKRAAEAEKSLEEQARQAKERLRQQRENIDNSIKRNPNLAAEQGDKELQAAQAGDERQQRLLSGSATKENIAAINTAAIMEKDNTLHRQSRGYINARTSEAVLSNVSAVSETADIGLDVSIPVSAEATVRKTAALEQAKEAAKPLVQNGSQVTEVTQGQKEVPRTQTAAVHANAPATGRA